MNSNGDSFKRVKIAGDHYRCGCQWERQSGFGDVLIECPIHSAASAARFSKFEKRTNRRTR